MTTIAKKLTTTSLAVLLTAATAVPAFADSVAEGKKLAFDRKLGNCLACHAMGDGVSPGDIGPPLIAMKARYPNRAALKEQIADPTKRNPETIMPPFGKHGALSDAQIEAIVDYVLTL